MLAKFSSAVVLTSLLTAGASASSFAKRNWQGPKINTDFPDPGLMRNSDGVWYAYSTSSSHGRIPYATSNDFNTWTIRGDALASLPNGADPGIWAPDVREIDPSHYVMYYAIKTPSSGRRCIGFATSNSPAGPFTPKSNTLVCNDQAGGVIDPASFLAPGGPMYLVWKVDGNAVGSSSTPIQIQQLSADGQSLVGSVRTILDRDDGDGPLVEAPSLIYWQGWYYLFFSSNVYSSPQYDISYATARSALGPYTKARAPNAPLLVSGNGLTGPGHPGAVNVLDQYVNIAFAALINGNINNGRAMYTAANLCLNNGVVKFDGPC